MNEQWSGVTYSVADSADARVTLLAIGVRGWVFLHDSSFRHEVRAKVAEDIQGRVAVNTLWVWATDTLFGPGYISPIDLRGVALGRLEHLLNSPDLLQFVRQSLGADEGPDFNPAVCPPGTALELAAALPQIDRQRVLRITIPPGKRKSDQFYEAVAGAFAIAAQTSTKPAKEIADANGLVPGTVHQWIKEARRRGLLPPGRRTQGGATETTSAG